MSLLSVPETIVPSAVTTGHTGAPSLSGVAFWKWTASESQWIMVDDRSEPGFEYGDGPTQPGRFDGQTVRWASVPSR